MGGGNIVTTLTKPVTNTVTSTYNTVANAANGLRDTLDNLTSGDIGKAGQSLIDTTSGVATDLYQGKVQNITDTYQGFVKPVITPIINALTPEVPSPTLGGASAPLDVNAPGITDVAGKKKKKKYSSMDELRSGLAATVKTSTQDLLGSATVKTPTAIGMGKQKLGQ